MDRADRADADGGAAEGVLSGECGEAPVRAAAEAADADRPEAQPDGAAQGVGDLPVSAEHAGAAGGDAPDAAAELPQPRGGSVDALRGLHRAVAGRRGE